VVVEFAGTTTVVFAGGGGLPLLMQPHSIPAAIIKVVTVFILSSDVSGNEAIFGKQARPRQGPSA
jgi:hypothetical protein